jgi:hypothetical protein
MTINTVSDFRKAYRAGPYAWPGGYPMYFITSDGAALSFDAAKSARRNILHAIAHKQNDGWRVVAIEINWEDSNLFCEHTGGRIESAYAEDDIEC